MKAVWKLYKRQIIRMAVIAAVLGYCFAAWGAWAMRDPDDVTLVADVARLTLIYGTLVSVVLFVLIVGVVIPRSAYYSDRPMSDRSRKVFCSGSDVLDEMAEERSDRISRNLGMWGTENDMPTMPTMDDF